MIKYHGLPITPDTAAVEVAAGGHVFVSYAHPGQVGLAIEYAQSMALDNGAFPAWRRGEPIQNWHPYYAWVEQLRRQPVFDWAVVPDVIDGSEADNDALLCEWPLSKFEGVPVWHMHESLSRLERLSHEWPRVALGSSGQYATVGTPDWWDRMSRAMAVLCDNEGRPVCKLHGLRMLNPKVFTKLPLSSADSTNIGRNIGIDRAWKGTYTPATKPARARVMRQRIELENSAQVWVDPLFA